MMSDRIKHELDLVIARGANTSMTRLEYVLSLQEAYMLGYQQAMIDALKMTDDAIAEKTAGVKTDG